MAAAVFLLVIFSFFHSVLPDSFSEQFKSCLPLYCGNTTEINPRFANISRPPHCGPFWVDSCDEEPFDKRLVTAIERIYDFDSLSNVSLSFMSESKEFQRQLNSSLCQSSDRLNLTILQDVASHVLSNLTLFKCNRTIFFPPSIQYEHQGCQNVSFYEIHENENLPSLPPRCSAVHLQVNDSNYDEIFALLAAKVSLEEDERIECYRCLAEGSKCEPKCLNVQKGGGRKRTEKWLIVAASVTAIGILVIGVCCYARKLASYKREVNNDIEAFLKNYGSLAPKRYSYSEVKKMTRSFKDRLGQGGYGSVFKGKLPDGSLVAVKVLNNSKGNGAEFINEVASISRTSHVNIVTLLGFCFNGPKRALIYEFMPNGSLDKYIYNEQNAPIAVHQLDCKKLNQIALGIARGLEYLHGGCNTRIVHFDIKPHNILLDENLCLKISDFGLAKICSKRESNISMEDIARGTVGYIAPEVFCRTFGGVSHKSDVYSYGMLVLEMIGGRRSPRSITVDNTSEIFFPELIHKRFELGEELGLPGINCEEENNVTKKLVLVSLWCIQTDPSSRPPVNRVVEMLQASLESLPIPPRPCFSSPSEAPEISMASSPMLSSGQLDF